MAKNIVYLFAVPQNFPNYGICRATRDCPPQPWRSAVSHAALLRRFLGFARGHTARHPVSPVGCFHKESLEVWGQSSTC